MNVTRRTVLLSLLAFGMSLSAPLHAGWFGPDVKEVEVGSSSSGTLEVKKSRRFSVKTRNLPPKTTEWVSIEKNGTRRVTNRLVQNPIANTYSSEITSQGTLDVWQITGEDVTEPVNVVIRIRGKGFLPVTAVFIDVESAGDLDPEKGVRIPESDFADNETIGILTYDPKKKYFITVQSDEPTHADYRVSVIRASKYQQ